MDKFLAIVNRYTKISELTPRILHEFVEKIVAQAVTDPHGKIKHTQQIDIDYKGIGTCEMPKIYATWQE